VVPGIEGKCVALVWACCDRVRRVMRDVGTHVWRPTARRFGPEVRRLCARGTAVPASPDRRRRSSPGGVSAHVVWQPPARVACQQERARMAGRLAEARGGAAAGLGAGRSVGERRRGL